MRILGTDYVENEKLLTICIIDNIDRCMKVIEIKHMENVANKKQAIRLCKQLSKKFDCDKVLLEDNLKI